ncbi:MAG: nuclear transport factor 2 family protein [Halobaculum sp.]
MSEFAAWLDRYGEAWETRDPDRAAALFTADATYHRTPFEAVEGRPAIRDYWADATSGQRDVSVETTVVADPPDGPAVGRFVAEYDVIEEGGDGNGRESVRHTTLDGTCLVTLDGDRCRVFREWWHKRTE